MIKAGFDKDGTMFRFIRFFAFSLFLSFSAKAEGVAVPSSEARLWANSKGQELIQTLSLVDPIEKYAKLDKMMTEDVNLDYISKFVIGKYARLMNAEQKERYSKLFHRYVLSLYRQTNLSFDASKIQFSINNVTEYDKFTTVSCLVDAGKLLEGVKGVEVQKLPVKFKLIRGRNNRIQAVDVEISEVSMVIEYRKRFYQMIKEDGENINWFLDKFDDKIRANEEAFSKNAGI